MTSQEKSRRDVIWEEKRKRYEQRLKSQNEKADSSSFQKRSGKTEIALSNLPVIATVTSENSIISLDNNSRQARFENLFSASSLRHRNREALTQTSPKQKGKHTDNRTSASGNFPSNSEELHSLNEGPHTLNILADPAPAIRSRHGSAPAGKLKQRASDSDNTSDHINDTTPSGESQSMITLLSRFSSSPVRPRPSVATLELLPTRLSTVPRSSPLDVLDSQFRVAGGRDSQLTDAAYVSGAPQARHVGGGAGGGPNAYMSGVAELRNGGPILQHEVSEAQRRKLQYQRELQEQIRQKQDAAALEKQLRQQREQADEENMRKYDMFGTRAGRNPTLPHKPNLPVAAQPPPAPSSVVEGGGVFDGKQRGGRTDPSALAHGGKEWGSFARGTFGVSDEELQRRALKQQELKEALQQQIEDKRRRRELSTQPHPSAASSKNEVPWFAEHPASQPSNPRLAPSPLNHHMASRDDDAVGMAGQRRRRRLGALVGPDVTMHTAPDALASPPPVRPGVSGAPTAVALDTRTAQALQHAITDIAALRNELRQENAILNEHLQQHLTAMQSLARQPPVSIPPRPYAPPASLQAPGAAPLPATSLLASQELAVALHTFIPLSSHQPAVQLPRNPVTGGDLGLSWETALNSGLLANTLAHTSPSQDTRPVEVRCATDFIYPASLSTSSSSDHSTSPPLDARSTASAPARLGLRMWSGDSAAGVPAAPSLSSLPVAPASAPADALDRLLVEFVNNKTRF